MSRRQTEGGETWRRLREWDRGQAPSERMAAHILRVEGYETIDPSHPLGGQDGLKDIVCVKDKVKFIGACYFPRGQQNFSSISNKFLDDLEGVNRNDADGIAFVTNQELTLAERVELTEKAGSAKVDLFHLERIASILDSPRCYGLRLEFLDIEMTKEEQLAFMATVSHMSERLDDIIAHINKSEILREELKKITSEQDKPKDPRYATPVALTNDNYLFSSVLGGGAVLKKCSHCGYGYLVKKPVLPLITSFSIFAGQNQVVACPKCGNADHL